ncbi:ArsR family transcriptional regulator [Candidatus Endobugula sertula]|uniref:ArsR family transcriptional regulator n=1 Tax=Candidatus Endobugula sertula TaxID=62101 RepID=A0A1D2QPK5_9GAMM|nr:ArsR family transcriptional regulator [Candidatus Endobugula sertula]
MNSFVCEHVPTIAELAAFNKAGGEGLRLEILRVLAQDSYGVLELCEILGHRQSGMSHHLKVLTEAGLVEKRREGNSIFYHRALLDLRQVLASLQQQLYAVVDKIGIPSEVLQRLQHVKRERMQNSQQFFVRQADKFKAQQDLIAEYPVYGEAVAEVLCKTVTEDHAIAVEVGPGAGEFLVVLSKRFDQVVALDNAPTMLERAQNHCWQQAISNVDFICDDTDYLARGNVIADCVVMNMVLHHTSSPADIFIDIATSLKPGGVLIVTDLCRHDQDWAKTACGDIWLGFDPAELQHWALLAGLKQGHSNYLALRNGFQIQLQQFKKT